MRLQASAALFCLGSAPLSEESQPAAVRPSRAAVVAAIKVVPQDMVPPPCVTSSQAQVSAVYKRFGRSRREAMALSVAGGYGEAWIIVPTLPVTNALCGPKPQMSSNARPTLGSMVFHLAPSKHAIRPPPATA